jgi:hypothetical protein
MIIQCIVCQELTSTYASNGAAVCPKCLGAERKRNIDLADLAARKRQNDVATEIAQQTPYRKSDVESWLMSYTKEQILSLAFWYFGPGRNP